jgi:pimeloyl-ACP methyl ester carboxylesterase
MMAPTEPSKAMQQLQATQLDVLEQQIARGQLSDELRAVLGDELAAEMERIAQARGPIVLADEERPPVVVLPGIIGSSLMNIVGDIGTIWLSLLALIAGKLSYLQLDPSGEHDASPSVQIVAAGLMPTHYLPIQLYLKVLGGCDVLGFPYDWRRSLDDAVERLRSLVVGQFQQSGRKVHLVGHSMGGLVARNLCLRHPDEAAQTVAQIIQLGAPNYGSCESIRNLTVGGDTTDLLERLNHTNAPLTVMRSCPGLYAMLPAPAELYPADAPFPYPYAGSIDAYDPAAYGVDTISAAHIQAARAGYAWLATAGEMPVPVTVIAGYDVPTCLRVTRSDGSPGLMFMNGPEGDGTVPLASATALPGARRLYGRGLEHGSLPLYEVVRRAVRDLVHGAEPSGLESAPYTAMLGAEAEETDVPRTPPPGTLGEGEIDAIAARVRSDQATPEDLRILSGVH